MNRYNKLFGKAVHIAPDMKQALEALHKHADSNDPIGTIIRMDVDDDGNVRNAFKELPHLNQGVVVPTWIVGRFAVTGIRDQLRMAVGRLIGQMGAVMHSKQYPYKAIPIEDWQYCDPEIDMTETKAIWLSVYVKAAFRSDMASRLGRLLIPKPVTVWWCRNSQAGCTFEPGTYHEFRWFFPVTDQLARFYQLPVGYDECESYWKCLKRNNVDLNYFETLPRWTMR